MLVWDEKSHVALGPFILTCKGHMREENITQKVTVACFEHVSG